MWCVSSCFIQWPCFAARIVTLLPTQCELHDCACRVSSLALSSKLPFIKSFVQVRQKGIFSTHTAPCLKNKSPATLQAIPVLRRSAKQVHLQAARAPVLWRAWRSAAASAPQPHRAARTLLMSKRSPWTSSYSSAWRPGHGAALRGWHPAALLQACTELTLAALLCSLCHGRKVLHSAFVEHCCNTVEATLVSTRQRMAEDMQARCAADNPAVTCQSGAPLLVQRSNKSLVKQGVHQVLPP